MRYYIFIILLSLNYYFCYTQNPFRVEGIVTEADTGEPLISVNSPLPYGQIGLYTLKGSKIESQNFEYGGGLLINTLRFPHFELSIGYQGYNRNHQYNNTFFGLRYTLPLTPIYYY